jgi:hypothetical protein
MEILAALLGHKYVTVIELYADINDTAASHALDILDGPRGDRGVARRRIGGATDDRI